MLIVGRSLTAVTVSTNVSFAVSEPSLTVTVIVAVPVALATGVTVTVRFAPVPPNTMPPIGDDTRVRRGAAQRQAADRRLGIADREGDRARRSVFRRAAIGDVGNRRRRVRRRDRQR